MNKQSRYIVKVDSSKDKMESSRHVERGLNLKVRNFGVVALDYIKAL
jgi:hypothetical protein